MTAFRRHMVIVGSSGSGKTNLMIRLWAGWMAASLAAARRGRPRPLLVAMDCKGGPDARAKADRTRRVLRGTGAGRVADLARRRHPVPVDAAAREPRRAAVPDDRARRRVRRLLRRHHPGRDHPSRDRAARPAVQRGAVPRPPRPRRGWRTPGRAGRPTSSSPWPPPARTRAASSSATRPCWLVSAPASTAPAASKTPTPGTSSSKAPPSRRWLRRRRWRSPSWSRTPPPPGAPSPGRSCSPPTTTAPSAAGCRCRTSTSAAGPSASGVMVSAQSWQGLGRDDDERYRIAATADGGVWLMQTPYPEPLCQLAGTHRVLESRPQAARHRVGRRGHQPHPARLDRQPRPHPPARHRAGLPHPPGISRLRADRPPPPRPAPDHRRAYRPGRPATPPRRCPA